MPMKLKTISTMQYEHTGHSHSISAITVEPSSGFCEVVRRDIPVYCASERYYQASTCTSNAIAPKSNTKRWSTGYAAGLGPYAMAPSQWFQTLAFNGV